ncbi:MAG: hypothetical protein LUE16_06675 [Lachnospiraceae bacterium]|nr:hypothetical protein [Lachnospiraceae bacterium]
MHPKARTMQQPKKKVYVKVSSDTDQTGYVEPKIITWTDGRQYRIEDVKDVRPAGTAGAHYCVDCYTVVIKGQRKHLFYELVDDRFLGRHGRWYVEV